MRVMVLIKANEQSERGEMPSEMLLTEMTAFNEELVKAGVMLAGEGLHPSSKGVRVAFEGAEVAPLVADAAPAVRVQKPGLGLGADGDGEFDEVGRVLRTGRTDHDRHPTTIP